MFTPEQLPEFFAKRFDANGYKAEHSSLDIICGDMERLILPHIHKFENLDYCYNGLIDLRKAGGCKSIESCLEDYVLYGLSIKLRKYENALPYVNFQLS